MTLSRQLQDCSLSARQQHLVLERIADCLHLVEHHLGLSLAMPQTSFDLGGSAAGQYRQHRSARGRIEHQLRFNPCLLARHFDDSLGSTVPHEVAHYVVAALHGHGRVRPHGVEWRKMMGLLGAAPEVVHHYSVAGLEVRRQRRWQYRCACRHHELSTTRHHRALRGVVYRCRTCRQVLSYIDTAE